MKRKTVLKVPPVFALLFFIFRPKVIFPQNLSSSVMQAFYKIYCKALYKNLNDSNLLL